MISVRVSSNADVVAKRIAARAKKVEKQGRTTTSQIASETRDQIMRFMPRDTGQSSESIGYIITTSNKGYVSATIGIRGKPHPEKTWNGVWFNLPWYMFEGEGALTQHFRSGNISMLRQVPRMMREKYKRRIEVDVSRILKE